MSVALLLLLRAGDSSAMCFAEAGARYSLPPQLLCAVAACESNLRPEAMNRSHEARTGTVDIGLMQINSSHLPWLRKHGISEDGLMDACTNVHVGAYILASNLQRYGDTWEAVGAYNAACSQLKGEKCLEARSRYAWCVHSKLARCASLGSAPPVTATPRAGRSPGIAAISLAEESAAAPIE